MPEFIVRTHVSGWREYTVPARGPWDAIEKVEANHPNAELLDEQVDEEADRRYTHKYER